MSEVLIKTKDKADKQCEKEVVGAKNWNLKEIEVFKKTGKWHKDLNCRGWVVDDSPGYWVDAFPIWKTDTFDDVLKKYWQVFKWEALYLKEHMIKEREAQYDRGFSKSRNMRFSAKLPETLSAIIKKYFPQYYTKKGMKYLKEKVPVYFV